MPLGFVTRSMENPNSGDAPLKQAGACVLVHGCARADSNDAALVLVEELVRAPPRVRRSGRRQLSPVHARVYRDRAYRDASAGVKRGVSEPDIYEIRMISMISAGFLDA